mgnify:CR=1 FL=1
MSKPRKKYNPLKASIRTVEQMFRKQRIALVYVVGQHDGRIIFYSMKHRKEVNVNLQIQQLLMRTPHNWSIFCAAMGRRQDGQEYMKAEQIDAPRCNHAQVTEQLSHIHMRILQEMNPAHRVGAGWIACPFAIDLDESEAGEVFDRLGGWELEKLELRDVA